MHQGCKRLLPISTLGCRESDKACRRGIIRGAQGGQGEEHRGCKRFLSIFFLT